MSLWSKGPFDMISAAFKPHRFCRGCGKPLIYVEEFSDSMMHQYDKTTGKRITTKLMRCPNYGASTVVVTSREPAAANAFRHDYAIHDSVKI